MQQLLIAATLIPPIVALAALVFVWAWASTHKEEESQCPSE